MTVNCSNRIIKKQLKIDVSSAWFTDILISFRLLFVPSPHPSLPVLYILSHPTHPLPCNIFSLDLFGSFFLYFFISFNLLLELSLPPHHGFCFLSQVHVAQIQIAAGRERAPVAGGGQPALQAGVRREDQQPSSGGGTAQETAEPTRTGLETGTRPMVTFSLRDSGRQELARPRQGLPKGRVKNGSWKQTPGGRCSVENVSEGGELSTSSQEQTAGPRKSELCQLCQKESTRSQKKNICKNCGGIFCEACSANELPLPSSINPERVCNPCHEHLMQQYSTSPS